ncbi:helix-turn-helix domain-containing protein [Vagococcus lutrae]|uniref:helix-turn-helix domain-containing protein n=1 Tax=Vagococcus lutrae TaxID=81947 RepID=UPI0028920B02|nr:helix-turn-helix domain-containing protein [Vagococcus lutrae]MDT2842638.1 helix-turn-helix domain-containing protein [Vagococcus lutrae]
MSENKASYYAIIPANVRYDSELIPSAKLLYGEITALCNKEGYCWASDTYFSNLYEVSKKTIQTWLKSLETNGYITREVVYKEGSNEIVTRYIRLSVYPMHEKVSTPTHEKVRDNITSINTTVNNTTNIKPSNEVEQKETSKENELKERFEAIWKIYPNKKGKRRAYPSYKAAIKEGTTDEQIIKGIESYIEECKRYKTNKEHMLHGSTFFYQRRWEDDYNVGGLEDRSGYDGPTRYDELF